MMKRLPFALLACLFLIGDPPTSTVLAQSSPSRGDELVADYFRKQTELLSDQTFADIETLDDWKQRRGEYRRQLLEMLGMDPMPEKTPLHAEVTGIHQREGVIVENVQFQAMPGLYVTGNLYRPADQTGPLPAVLYVCGHGRVKSDGVSYGNKVAYQHHGGWFARNGYVCLTIDTVQLGEIEGIHHGTYREGMWWWNNRGYSSAGVEAYNCIRAVDYLQSRPEVDGDRIGVTGRSGGGIYSWWIAALDERIRAAVPVAGITSLKNHVVDGCVEGHCDCMFQVNTYRWDYPMVAALVAPRPLLITNSDKDRIFPLDGVVDVYTKVRKIYALYDATENLGLQISEGPHKDTQELRVAAFRWMNRFLRDDTELISTTATPLFEKEELKVFDELPEDERTSNIHESFVPKVGAGQVSIDSDADAAKIIAALRQKTFGGWPTDPEPLDVVVEKAEHGSHARRVRYTSESPYRLTLYWFRAKDNADEPVEIRVLDEAAWQRWAPALAAYFPEDLATVPTADADPDRLAAAKLSHDIVFVAPRGVGPTAWSDDERTRTHIRRRFMLLGQTLAGMQIYDVVRAIEAIEQRVVDRSIELRLAAGGEAAVWSAYASLFVDGIDALQLKEVPASNRDAPDLLNVSRIIELSDVVKLANRRVGD